ncbi:MAG: phage terminase large subunit family protein [Pyrobaculum sp.]
MEIRVRPSDFVQAILKLNGKPFSLKGRDWLIPIYDGDYKRIIMYTGRQVEKSTTIAGHLLSRTLLIPYFQALYVAPTSEQAKIFAHQKLDPFIRESEVIRRYYKSSELTDRVFEKEFRNGSRIMLGYAYLNPDRLRGRSADALYIDEIQDFITDEIPVLEETLSHSVHKYRVFAGTPKHLQSAIEFYWRISTQTEWVIKCEGCGKWNILDERNVKREGLSCAYCGALLNVRNGEWADAFPGAKFYGIRIPQLIVPWVDWEDLWDKYTRYPRQKFYNEVLAKSYDSAQNAINKEDLLGACGEHENSEERFDHVEYNRAPMYMGIDYAATQTATGSYTVVVIGGFVHNKFKVAYMKRYEGQEAEFQNVIADVVRLAQKFSVKRVAADWGVGSGGANAVIRSELAKLRGNNPMENVWEFYYSANLKELVKWDKQSMKFIVSRTDSITNLFLRIKERKVEFPKASTWQAYMEDFLNVFVDYNERTGRIFYNKEPNKSDDFVHALNFALIAALIDRGELTPIIAKISESDF